MRNLKRALSLALASVMLLGMMVVGTSAASYPDVDSKDNLEAIEVMKLLGVMTGDDKGNFNPDQNVTRNEMAVVMVNLMDLKIEDYKGTAPFTDVPAWAEPYVSACYANKIVSGASATTYNGAASVTAAEAALMMQKALGYFQYQADFGDDWTVATIKNASKIDLFDGMSVSAKTPLTRNQVAKLALNALEADVVEADGNGGTTIKGDGFEISTGSTKYETVMTTVADYQGRENNNDGKNTQQLVEKLFGDDVEKATTDETDKLGRPAIKWTKDGDEDTAVTATKEAKYVVTLEKSYDDAQDLLDLAKKDIEAADGIEYALNKATAGIDHTDFGAGDTLYFYVTDKKVTGVYGARYELGKIDEVDTDVTKADAKDGVSAYVDFTDDFGYTTTGVNDTDIPGFDAETYVKDAVIALCVNDDDEIVDSYVVKSVKGSAGTTKVTDSQNYLTVDGTKYIEAEGAAVVANVTTGSDNTYKFYLDNNGYVLGYETVDEAAISIDDTYVVESVWYDQTTGKNGVDEYKFYARLVALDGTVKVVELEAEGNVYNDGADAVADYDLADVAAAEWDTEAALTAMGLDETVFVTISDKDVKNVAAIEADEEAGQAAVAVGALKLAKKDNDKFNLGAWDFEDNKYEIAASLEGQLEADDTKNNGIRLNSNTQFVMIAVEDDEVTTKVYTGAIKFNFETKAEGGNVVLVDADKDTTALYVVVFCGDDADNTKLDKVESEDYIFVNDVTTATVEQNADYKLIEVYTATGAKETWKVETDEETLNGFYTYSKDDKGIYTLEEATEVLNVAEESVRDWNKDEDIGVIVDADDITCDALDQDLLTVGSLADIKIKNAKFVDLHDTEAENQYERAITSVSALNKLIENEKVGDFAISLSVDKDGAIVIFLTDAAAYVAG